MSAQPRQSARTRQPFNMRRLIFVGCFTTLAAIAACLVLIFAPILLVGQITAPLRQVTDAWLEAVREDNAPGAYALMSTQAQARLGTSERLFNRLREYDIDPVSWTYNTQSINNQTGSLEGTVRLAEGGGLKLTVAVVLQGEAWRINSITIGTTPFP